MGSTLIDWKIRMLIKERLSHVKHYLTADIDSTVSAMMQDKFETFKCSFGSVGKDVPKLFLRMSALCKVWTVLTVVRSNPQSTAWRCRRFRGRQNRGLEDGHHAVSAFAEGTGFD